MRWQKLVCGVMLNGLFVSGAQEAWAARYVAGKGSSIEFVANHPTHEIRGKSVAVNAAIEYDPARPAAFEGIIGKPVQAAWQSFDSGNANRDANMRSAVNAQAYPNLTFVPTGVTGTTQAGAEIQAKLQGRLYINGVRREIEVPVAIKLSNPAAVQIHTAFSVKMSDYEIERPALLFVKTDDDVAIAVNLIFITEP